jgi:hypothetical protein
MRPGLPGGKANRSTDGSVASEPNVGFREHDCRGRALACFPGGTALPDEPKFSASIAPAADQPAPSSLAASRAPTPGEAAFGVWLEGSLRERYGAVVAEPVPETLLRLLA